MLRTHLLLFPKSNLIEALPPPLLVLFLHLRLGILLTNVLIGYPPGYNKNPCPKKNGSKTVNADSASTSNENGTSLSFTNEQIMKLVNLINKVPSGNMQANMADEFFQSVEENCNNNINNLNFFDEKHSDNQTSLSPNDDGRVNFAPNDEGNVYPCTKSTQTSDGSEDNIATSMGENTSYEGIVISSFGLNAQNFLKNTSQVQPDVRRSGKNVKLPARFIDYVVGSSRKFGLEKYISYSNLSAPYMYFSTNLNKFSEPNIYYEALKDTRLVEAMNNKIEALNRNNTWTICDLSKGRKPIGYKWLFKIKYNSTGEVERYKATLVAKGFNQREGFDYLETFSPVVKMATVRCMLNVAICNNWDLFQLDINNAFLYGDLSKDVYMTLPPGFDNDKSKASAKHVDTPLPENTTLNHGETDDDHLLKNVGNYQRLVGKLIYLTNTGLDNSYYVHCLSQYMHSSLESHLDAALGVLRYLKDSPGSGIQINKNGNLKLRAYDEFDWARCPATRKFVLSYCVILGDYLVTWKVIWLSNLLGDMGVKGLLHVVLYCDTSSALQIATNPVFHEKSKHFEINDHLVRENFASGVIKTEKIHTTQQIVDVFTKALDIKQHKILCEKLRLLDMFKVEKLEGWC
ncbi:ribonuclease H-like domain-containing protein [Tanacetum coccineum]